MLWNVCSIDLKSEGIHLKYDVCVRVCVLGLVGGFVRRCFAIDIVSVSG